MTHELVFICDDEADAVNADNFIRSHTPHMSDQKSYIREKLSDSDKRYILTLIDNNGYPESKSSGRISRILS